MITASMSTVGWREPILPRSIASILPQVDRLNVFLQGYGKTPECLNSPKVVMLRDTDAPESAALGASAKFHWLWSGEVADGYHFAVDDDIEYPPDYVHYCKRKIDEYGRRAIVGFHAATYPATMVRYFHDREAWSFERSCESDRFVHILGTGTSSWHTSTLRLTRDDFKQANSCDLYLGIACQKQRVPVLCLARPRGYLTPLPMSDDPRAASSPGDYAHRMVDIWRTWQPWEIHTAERSAPASAPVVVVVPCYNEPTERIERTIASAFATPGVDLVRVVDDGSAVPVELEPRDRLEVLRCAANGGPSSALNAGIRSLPADAIICRLDVGDKFYPEAKARQIAEVKSGAYRCSASPRFDPVRGIECHPVSSWQSRIYSDCQFSSVTTVYERSAWEEAGGNATHLRWCEDWLFAMRMQATHGWRLFPEVTCSAGEFPGGHSDVGGSPAKSAERSKCRAEVATIGQALRNPDKFAHLFNERWCKKRGIAQLPRPVSRSPKK